jgi:hypothetical protein
VLSVLVAVALGSDVLTLSHSNFTTTLKDAQMALVAFIVCKHIIDINPCHIFCEYIIEKWLLSHLLYVNTALQYMLNMLRSSTACSTLLHITISSHALYLIIIVLTLILPGAVLSIFAILAP